jgi:hypothetical protein
MPHKDCTCNSRTVDESGNVVHFEECEKEKDTLDELIKWMKLVKSEIPKDINDYDKACLCTIEEILNKAKEIKNGK